MDFVAEVTINKVTLAAFDPPHVKYQSVLQMTSTFTFEVDDDIDRASRVNQN